MASKLWIDIDEDDVELFNYAEKGKSASAPYRIRLPYGMRHL